MCEICLKYRCPDRCPNNYVPRGRGKRSGRLYDFVMLTEIESVGTTCQKESIPTKK